MKIYSPKLFLEIDHSKYIFAVGDKDEKKNFVLIHKCIVPAQGIEEFKITNFDLIYKTIKENIYLIEQKLNFTFRDIVLIINNLNISFINLTGFKKLNGSQILKENITYILNSLKSNLYETEEKKTIVHIFNSKYFLDKKEIENLPIGLFGDFYSQELSFSLLNSNDYKNLNNIFDKCNLKIKKIFLKSFVEGSFRINKNEKLDTFFQINIEKNNSQIFYFENGALKFEQMFNFGSDLIIKDISKVTSLKIDIINEVLKSKNLIKDLLENELIEKDFFKNKNYIKIKKKLILDIAEARIEEILNKIIIKNINFTSFNKKEKIIFLKISDESHFNSFKKIYSLLFSKNSNLILKFIERVKTEDLIKNANKLVHYGWNKEAIPVTHTKKSTITKFFDILFN
jgi:cell division protein FtsA